MNNCPNCGAPMTTSQCEYCGTKFSGRSASIETRNRHEQRRVCIEQELARATGQLYVDTTNLKRLYDKLNEEIIQKEKIMKKSNSIIRGAAVIITMIALALILVAFCGCDVEATSNGSYQDRENTIEAANELQYNQPTPTDIEYSLERYNLIRRAYWVNGQREKANTIPCPIEKPLGYVILLTESGSVVGKFTVDGKVSSLNSFLTPDSEYYEIATGASSTYRNDWLADVDGSYGANDNGIFFFTPDGKYVEWSGIYLYSDIPFEVDAPVVNYTEVN